MLNFAWQPVLMRKEAKQLWPLFAVIALSIASIGFFMGSMALIEQNRAHDQHAFIGGLLLLSPAMFALGAGAIAIGQEKEKRTLDWLSSLPVTRRQLCWNKLISSASLLFSLWLASGFVSWIGESLFEQDIFVGSLIADEHPFRSLWFAYWVLNSAYLLVCGHLLAWQFGSAVVSVLATLPLAMIPTLLRFVCSRLWESLGWQETADSTLWGGLLSLGLCFGVAVWLTDRVAAQSIVGRPLNIAWLPEKLFTLVDVRSRRTSEVILPPASALLWQSWMQNRWVMGLLLVCCSVAFFVSLSVPTEYELPSVLCFILLSLLSICVSGTLMYFGDVTRDRIRFLAERGVRPSSIWWSRLLIPIAIASMLVMCIRYLTVHEYTSSSVPPEPESIVIPLWLLTVFALFVLGYAQWWTQLATQPIVGFIGAPLWVCLVGTWAVYCWQEAVWHVWMLVPLVLTPFLATRLGMRLWMDRRTGLKFYLLHGSLFLASALIPLFDLVWFATAIPSIPEPRRQALLNEAKEILQATNRIEFLHPITNADVMQKLGVSGTELEVPDDYALLTSDEQLQSLRERVGALQSASANIKSLPRYKGWPGISFKSFAVVQAFYRLEPTHLAMRERYRLELLVLFEEIKRLRRGVTVWTIREATHLESQLVNSLQSHHIEEILGTEDYRAMVEYCGDRELRKRDRRQTIIASMYHEMPLGPASKRFSSLQRWLVRQRLAEYRVELLLRLLEDRRMLEDPVLRGQWAFESEQWSADEDRWLVLSFQDQAWEQAAVELKDRLFARTTNE